MGVDALDPPVGATRQTGGYSPERLRRSLFHDFAYSTGLSIEEVQQLREH